ncbi:unnamed protein product [Sphenostylis stenocarpa]|uniref:RIN4 pathogenic type III effector avirulence factor Avr cleavage site domain-containing protein n=1 Tax=Sphenostylis stenocarpa TaxID=92480 RepID=A0AA86V8H1_9FABA|nr:unnamed protein product [Sphenostylis stenocarpa]
MDFIDCWLDYGPAVGCRGLIPLKSIFPCLLPWSHTYRKKKTSLTLLPRYVWGSGVGMARVGSRKRSQHSHDAKFGTRENEENDSDTAYSDKAHKGQPCSKVTNPNELKKNSDQVSSADLPHSKPRVHSEDPSGKGAVISAYELQKSKEDDDAKRFTDSPARHDNGSNRSGTDSTHRSQGIGSAENRRRPSRQTTGSEHNIDRSPLHRQAKTPGRDSPSWEVKNSYESSHGTPGRSRLRPSNRGDETPDKGAAVPKFGEWDESNPASADGYTHIFNKVRKEKQVGAGHMPGTPNARQYAARNQPADDKAQVRLQLLVAAFAGGKNDICESVNYNMKRIDKNRVGHVLSRDTLRARL